ncbi:quinone oxidoreductase family protein [Aquiflexum lacus]|uniref:quinone oxidoreductase family protein n=1 Tax=Aquiflexum lacus TaxID=2483805 RepID=UPI0018935C89|nr:zinc-binding dehydrogenase [Aquiflexum lacus]
MKAITLNLELLDKIELSDIDLPDLGSNDVLVHVKAAAINHRDEWCRQGLYPNLKNGVVLGSDGAGTIAEVGAEVDSSWVGKEVIINPAMNWGDDQRVQSKDFKILGMPDNGTLAEYVKVPVDRVHLKPDHLNWAESAGLPLGGLTAYRAVCVQGQVQKGNKVLVTGFGGGVAQFAVQFALANGAKVYVNSSKAEKIKKAKELGVENGFDYTDDNWSDIASEETGGFDLIIDSAMGDTLDHLIKVIKPGGRIVFYGATKGNPKEFQARKVFWNQIQLIGSTMGSDLDFEQMLALVKGKNIVPVIDKIFKMGDFVQAFDRMKEGLQTGKIVIRILQ